MALAAARKTGARVHSSVGDDLRNVVLVGWRHLELELEEDGRQTDVSFDGPLVGVLFGW
jgi:hypothetical protein